MKKIPSLLAGLVVSVSTLGAGVPIINHLAKDVSAIAQPSWDMIMRENTWTTFVETGGFNLATGSFNVVGKSGGFYPRRFVMAYRDYENGVTELEADALIGTLGVDDENWAIKIVDTTDLSATMETASLTYKNIERLTENRTDIVYYGMMYAEKVETENGVTWDNEWWVRGKWNYRDCAGSTSFDDKTMSCVRVLHMDGRPFEFAPYAKNMSTPIEVPDDARVVPWNEEWSQILFERYQAANKSLTDLDKTIQDGRQDLAQRETDLAKILALVKKLESDELGLEEKIDDTQPLIDRLHEFYAGVGNGDGDDAEKAELVAIKQELKEVVEKNTQLVKEKQDLLAANADLEEKNGQLGDRNTVLEQENAGLKDQNAELERENAGVKDQNAELERENAELREQNANLVGQNQALLQEIAELKAAMGKDELELQEENVALKAKNAELEQDKAKTEREKVELEERNAELMQRIEAWELQNKSNSGTLCAANTESILQNGDAENTGEQVGNESSDNQKVDRADVESVEIPNLGGEVSTARNWWWLLIPVVGLIGGVIWGVERKVRRS